MVDGTTGAVEVVEDAEGTEDLRVRGFSLLPSAVLGSNRLSL